MSEPDRELTIEVDLRDLRVGEMIARSAGDRTILICLTREGLFAVDDECTHAEAHLCEGRLRGLRVTCPLHGAAFDVRSGAVLKGPARQPIRSYPVRRDGARAWVTVPLEGTGAGAAGRGAVID
ncbi:MAG: Rieske 2Fe-2S domain-containing protein [Gammaproteobacteria bacterium]|nr:Rieske 2Fe-2S domain-containing protein [Gammaproteobacteria bacterium]